MKIGTSFRGVIFRIFSRIVKKCGNFVGTFSAFLLRMWESFTTFAVEQIY